MEEQYYLISTEKVSEILENLEQSAIANEYGGTKEMSDECRNDQKVIREFLSKFPLVDLSDSAIEEESNKVYEGNIPSSNIYGQKVGIKTALTNLKNKLNGNN